MFCPYFVYFQDVLGAGERALQPLIHLLRGRVLRHRRRLPHGRSPRGRGRLEGGMMERAIFMQSQDGADFHQFYRASHVLVDLGWVDLDLGSSPGWWAATVATYCPSRVVEHPKSKSTKPSPRGHGTPCTDRIISAKNLVFFQS